MSDYEDSDEIDVSEEINESGVEVDELEEEEDNETEESVEESENEEQLEEEIEGMVLEDPLEEVNSKALKNLKNELINDRLHKISYVVADDDRVTTDYIQLHEMTEAIGIRASQIENGSPVLIDTSNLRIADPITLATLEFYKRKSPLILKRVVRESETEEYIEKWKVREMKFYVHNITFRDYIEKLAPESVKKSVKGSFESFVSYDSDLAF